MSPVRVAEAPAPSPRRGVPLPSLLAGSLALVALGCTGGGAPFEPPGQIPATNTYVLAKATLLDLGDPCIPIDCEAEYFDCQTLQPLVAGTTWNLRADSAVAGILGDPLPNGVNVAISATDFQTRVGITLEIAIDVAARAASIVAAPDRTYVSVDEQCQRFNVLGIPESRFFLVSGNPQNVVTITSMETNGASIQPAVPEGTQGAFNPTGILEGTFSFVGTNRQELATGAISAQVLVEGCFRLNVPARVGGVGTGERGVPVTPTPAAPAAGCP